MLLTKEPAIITDGLEQLQKVDETFISKYLQELVPKALNLAIQVVLAVVIYLIGKRMIAFLRKVLRKSLERREVDLGVCQFLDSVSKYCLYAVLWLTVLTLFGVTTASVVALLGSAGLTLGLALQGSLANFAGGVLILLMKPFRVGDYMISGATGHEGTVKEISTFYTKILTVDNQTVMIPNGKLTEDAIVNVTGQQTRRLDLTVGISYTSDLRRAKELLADLVARDERILTDQPVQNFVAELAASSVELGCRFWVPSENYWQVKWDMLEAVKLVFDENQIEIPFQQIELHVKEADKIKNQ